MPVPGRSGVRRSSERNWRGLLGHLGKVGSNLNQLAHAFNRAGRSPALAELVTMREQVTELRDSLLKALGRAAQPGSGQSGDH